MSCPEKFTDLMINIERHKVAIEYRARQIQKIFIMLASGIWKKVINESIYGSCWIASVRLSKFTSKNEIKASPKTSINAIITNIKESFANLTTSALGKIVIRDLKRKVTLWL